VYRPRLILDQGSTDENNAIKQCDSMPEACLRCRVRRDEEPVDVLAGRLGCNCSRCRERQQQKDKTSDVHGTAGLLVPLSIEPRVTASPNTCPSIRSRTAVGATSPPGSISP